MIYLIVITSSAMALMADIHAKGQLRPAAYFSWSEI
jgi:hypothetical protein